MNTFFQPSAVCSPLWVESSAAEMLEKPAATLSRLNLIAGCLGICSEEECFHHLFLSLFCWGVFVCLLALGEDLNSSLKENC